MNEQIRVLLVDDHQLVRAGLRALLASEATIDVIGEAADGVEAVHKAHALQPDVILMDLMMPHKTGIEAIVEINQKDPAARILVLTTSADHEHVMAAIKAGARGYLVKESAPRELVQAIHQVYRGESALHPSIARKLLLELNRPAPVPSTAESLSTRETEVLVLVARGDSNQTISDTLFISERTVRTHVSSILSKLHLANRTQATLYALKEQLTKLEDRVG